MCMWEIKFARFRILMIATCCVCCASPPGPLQHATNPTANNYRLKQEETDSETVPQDVRHAVLFNLAFPSRQFFPASTLPRHCAFLRLQVPFTP